MRVIGMLGGMSWESSAEYYRLANEMVRDRVGGLHSARVLLDSVDFAEVEAMQADGRWEEAGVLLANRARALQAGGAELIVLCTNTMHKVFPWIAAAVSVPVLHIADAAAAAIRARALSRIGLLGTRFTMEQDFYSTRLTGHGIATIIPGPEDRDIVHRVIYDELVLGIVREESREAYRRVISRLVDAGAEGIVLGCTEIELLIEESDSPVHVFPTTRLHVAAAVEAVLSPAAG